MGQPHRASDCVTGSPSCYVTVTGPITGELFGYPVLIELLGLKDGVSSFNGNCLGPRISPWLRDDIPLDWHNYALTHYVKLEVDLRGWTLRVDNMSSSRGHGVVTMQEWEAGALLNGELDRAIKTVAGDGSIVCTYAVHRAAHPPVPTVVDPMSVSVEESRRVRSIVRCLSDVLSGVAVTMVAPILITKKNGHKYEGILGAVSWREEDGKPTGGKIQTLQVLRDKEGKVSQIKPFYPQGIESFVVGVMDGVISPVAPDLHSIAYARGMLEAGGFPQEIISPEETGEIILPPPTVH